MPSFYRDLFTGKLTERPCVGAGRQIIARIDPPPSAVVKKSGSVWGKPQKIRALAVHNEEVGEFNKDAPPGVRYVPGADGWASPEVDSRAARKAECERRGQIDRDGGYGDNTNLKEGWPIKRCAKPTIADIRAWATAARHERTHAPECWRRHPECLASLLLDRIDELEFLREIHGD